MYAPTNMDKTFMSICLLMTLCNVIIHFWPQFRKKKYGLNKILFRHTVIFVFCFLVVFFQCDLDYVLGFSEETDKLVWTDVSVVCKAMSLSLAALCSIFIGFDLYSIRFLKKKNHSEAKYTYNFRFQKAIPAFALLMILIYLFFVPKTYLYGGYSSGVDGGWANVILVLLQAVFIAMCSIYCYEYREDQNSHLATSNFVKAISVIIIYILVVFASGRRTEAIRMMFLLMLVYVYIKKEKVNYKLVFSICVVVALGITLLSLVRTDNDDTITDVYYSISPLTRELAGSVNTLHVALTYFPSDYPYTNGLTFFPNFLMLIPGLDQLYQTFIRGNGVITSSADLLTALDLGDNATYGIGSSIVADVFISFGPVGVVLLFILLGYFIKYLELCTFCKKCSPYFLVLSFGCCSQFMYACRGTIANLFLSWSYATILVFLLTSRKKTA